MGYKKVCFYCRKAFNLPKGGGARPSLTCPDCGTEAQVLSDRFRPPRREEEKQWEVAAFLVKHGFLYQAVYEIYTPSVLGKQQPYPATMKEAESFVMQFKAQAHQVKWDEEKGMFVKANVTKGR